MDNDEWEVEEQLYRVARRKKNHLSKENQSGRRKALQFSDEKNELDGPVELIEVSKNELVRREYVYVEPDEPRMRDRVVDELVMPNVEKLIDLGVDLFVDWLMVSGIPKAKNGAKKLKKLVSAKVLDFSGVMSGKTKAEAIIEERRRAIEKEKNEIADAEGITENKTSETGPKVERSLDEVKEIIQDIQISALRIMVSISKLKETVITDKEMSPKELEEAQKLLETLTSDMILGQIDLFLKDEKYSQYLTTNERADLSAFRKGCFLVDGKTERIDKYISLEVKSKA